MHGSSLTVIRVILLVRQPHSHIYGKDAYMPSIKLKDEHQQFVDDLKSKRNDKVWPFDLVDLNLINKAPDRYRVILLNAGVVFDYEKGSNESLGPYRVNLGYNDSHLFSSSDSKVVEVLVAIDVMIDGDLQEQPLLGLITPRPGEKYVTSRDVVVEMGDFVQTGGELLKVTWSGVGNG